MKITKFSLIVILLTFGFGVLSVSLWIVKPGTPQDSGVNSENREFISVSKFNDSFEVSKREVPPEYKGIYEFLEFIKLPQEPVNGFKPKEAPKWKVKNFLPFISENGVIFSDVNDGSKTSHKSVAEIRSALNLRQGKIFVTFSHLSHIYSIPYKQYSELSFQHSEGSYLVTLAGYYRLTFKDEGHMVRLSRCDYLNLEKE